MCWRAISVRPVLAEANEDNLIGEAQAIRLDVSEFDRDELIE